MQNLLQGPRSDSRKSIIMFNRCHLIVCTVLLLSSHCWLAYAKSLEHHTHHQQQHERVLRKRNAAESPSCELVQHFFESLNVSVNQPQQANENQHGKCKLRTLIVHEWRERKNSIVFSIFIQIVMDYLVEFLQFSLFVIVFLIV